MPDKEEEFKGQIDELRSLYGFNDDTTASDIPEDEDGEGIYIVGDVIAKGGLKVVREARDRKTGRTVAMAQLRPELESGQNRERFLREVRTLANLEHTNIVPLHEVNHDKEGNLFFTMKLLSGETLASILKKLGCGDEEYLEKYTIRDLLGILNRVCDAVSYAHSKGIVHLDLKPENIQVSGYGEVSVIDWGMSKGVEDDKTDDNMTLDLPSYTPLASSSDTVGTISGTPGYMSPEQAKSDFENTDIASDIYSLGAILYTMLYYKRPFHEFNMKDTIDNTKGGKLPDFAEKSNGNRVSTALQAVTRKAMMPDRSERYTNVESLQNEINLYLNDFATQAEDINFLKFSRLFIKRHSKALSITIIFAAIVSTIIYVSYSELKMREDILRAQNIKVNATADEIITGTLKKHELLRSQHKYAEIFSNYEKLRSVGYIYPEFWFDEAKLYVGQFNYEAALALLNKVSESGSKIAETEEFRRTNGSIKFATKILKERKLNLAEKSQYTLNLDPATQYQIWWTKNRNKNFPLNKRIEDLKEAIPHYNKALSEDNFNFEYSINDGYVKIDLSKNSFLYTGTPLLGIPVDELDISNSRIHLGSIADYLGTVLVKINASNIYSSLLNSFFLDSKIETIIAKNSNFQANELNNIPKLKHLDIEGAKVSGKPFTGSITLEHLNIAFTHMKDFGFLNNCPSLKTIIIDPSLNLPKSVLKTLDNLGTQVISKEKAHVEVPGRIEAEEFSTMSGVSTGPANDTGAGSFVGWMDPGDFMTYNIYVMKSGMYRTTLRMAGRKIHFKLSDKDKVLWDANRSGSSGWQDWVSINKEIYLNKGKNILRIDCTDDGWNLNWIELEYLD